MSKKIYPTAPIAHETEEAASPPADAAGLVETYRELSASATAARTAHSAYTAAHVVELNPHAPRSSEVRLRETELRRQLLQAEDLADLAARVASDALDAVELSAGDSLALTRNPAGLQVDLAALDAERSALIARVQDVDRRTTERIRIAHDADVAHAAKRTAAAAPPSVPLPRPGFGSYVTALGAWIAKGVPVTSRAAQIADCISSETYIAADLEEARLAKEAKKQEIAERNAANEREFERQQKVTQAKNAAAREEVAAEAKRRQKLATDYRSRQASS